MNERPPRESGVSTTAREAENGPLRGRQRCVDSDPHTHTNRQPTNWVLKKKNQKKTRKTRKVVSGRAYLGGDKAMTRSLTPTGRPGGAAGGGDGGRTAPGTAAAVRRRRRLRTVDLRSGEKKRKEKIVMPVRFVFGCVRRNGVCR